jgi:hypothetical protein
MTVALAWVAQRNDGLQHLYLASDSRLCGARIDAAPKILTLPRSDCALCFAGDTHATYPMMLQIANAIGAHQPARERSLDIARVKDHLLRVFTDLAHRFETPFTKADIQFIFAGYSWRSKEFRIWTIGYLPEKKALYKREATAFCDRLKKIVFIGDWAKRVRAAIAKELQMGGRGGEQRMGQGPWGVCDGAGHGRAVPAGHAAAIPANVDRRAYSSGGRRGGEICGPLAVPLCLRIIEARGTARCLKACRWA